MIGVFDSGLGGLTVLKELLKDLPEYDYLYLGDNARAPYGSKSAKTIYNYTKEAVDFLFKKGAELVIVACNTASAGAVRKLQDEYLPQNYPDKKILGVILPIVEYLIDNKEKEPIGIIGTSATITSGKYQEEILKLKKDAIIFVNACPLLVPLIEEGWIKKPETKMILKKYLRPLKEKKIETLVLGCTHYPVLTNEIKRIMGKNVKVLDAPKIISEKLADYLKRHPELKISKGEKIFYYTTDDTEKFKEQGRIFLNKKISMVEKIEL